MAGYRKIEAEVKPAQHMVTIVNGMTARQVKEAIACVPDITALKSCDISNDNGEAYFVFEEDVVR